MKLIKVMINFYPVFRLGTLKCTVKPLLARKVRGVPLYCYHLLEICFVLFFLEWMHLCCSKIVEVTVPVVSTS